MNKNLQDVLHAMQQATSKAPTNHVTTLIAATKSQTVARIIELIGQGVTDIGENRVQEAIDKKKEITSLGCRPHWHLIGPLQSNKVQKACQTFDVIHTLDREKTAQAVSEACYSLGKTMECFIQVNIGREAQKSGVDIEGLSSLIMFVRGLPAIKLVGLMAVPPAQQAPAPYFALLAKLAQQEGLAGLSMGMSSDYEIALALGATHIRLGTALFGARH